ncbi:hypothetical protein KUCAC02_033627 [Chaenocephalus aceratus]|nr:hypothetical protein KUCAC02_033627 [Chaenocephalus aceratus]
MKGLYCRAGVAEPKFVIQGKWVSVCVWVCLCKCILTYAWFLPDVLGCHLVRVQVKACGLSPLDLKLLNDVGIQRDLIPVGREVSGRLGAKVSFFQPQDEVVGILPLDSPCSGLCELIDIDEHYLVQKPEKLSPVCVAGALRDGLSAYTALHTHARMAAGHTLLVLDGGSSFGLMCIQLACYHGVKVFTTSHTAEEHTFLEQLRPSVGVQDPLVGDPVYNDQSELLSVVMEETGGLGVDIVIDSGGKHMMSTWKLDPPDCRLLHLKSASLTFLNHEVWTASSAQQGRYLHILKDIVEKMSTGVLRPRPEEAVPLYEATVTMETVQRHQKKKAVVQL